MGDELPWSLIDGLKLTDATPAQVLEAMGVEPTGWRVTRPAYSYASPIAGALLTVAVVGLLAYGLLTGGGSHVEPG